MHAYAYALTHSHTHALTHGHTPLHTYAHVYAFIQARTLVHSHTHAHRAIYDGYVRGIFTPMPSDWCTSESFTNSQPWWGSVQYWWLAIVVVVVLVVVVVVVTVTWLWLWLWRGQWQSTWLWRLMLWGKRRYSTVLLTLVLSLMICVHESLRLWWH